MGKLLTGAFGALTGKVGKLVSYELNGQNVIRRIGQVKSKPSQLQLASRKRFKVINSFLAPIQGFLNLGYLFAKQGTDKNQHNLASSYNLTHALAGKYPNITIDYSKVMVSSGTLEPALEPAVTKSNAQTTISWAYQENRDWAFRHDRAMILICYPSTNEAIYFLSGAQRKEGSQVIDLPTNLPNERTEFYLSFFAEDRLSVSESTWIPSY